MGTKRGHHRGTKYCPELLKIIYKQVIWAQSDRQSSWLLTEWRLVRWKNWLHFSAILNLNWSTFILKKFYPFLN